MIEKSAKDSQFTYAKFPVKNLKFVKYKKFSGSSTFFHIFYFGYFLGIYRDKKLILNGINYPLIFPDVDVNIPDSELKNRQGLHSAVIEEFESNIKLGSEEQVIEHLTKVIDINFIRSGKYQIKTGIFKIFFIKNEENTTDIITSEYISFKKLDVSEYKNIYIVLFWSSIFLSLVPYCFPYLLNLNILFLSVVPIFPIMQLFRVKNYVIAILIGFIYAMIEAPFISLPYKLGVENWLLYTMLCFILFVMTYFRCIVRAVLNANWLPKYLMVKIIFNIFGINNVIKSSVEVYSLLPSKDRIKPLRFPDINPPPSPDGDIWEIYKDNAGEWRWRRTTQSGEIVGASVGSYINKSDCEANARRHGMNLDPI